MRSALDQTVSIPRENKSAEARAAFPAAFARAITGDCAALIAVGAATLRETGGAAAAHQLRVALRRARAALSIFGDVAKDEARALREELRWAGRAIAPLRDLDVLIADGLAGASDDRREPPGLDAIRAIAVERRAAALEAATAAIGSARFEQAVASLQQWAAPAPGAEERDDGDIGDFAARDLRRRWRAIRKRRDAISHDDPAARHRLRLRCKKLRLAIEFFGDVTPPSLARRRKKAAKALSKLQDRLGRLNDAETHAALLLDIARSADAAAAFAGGYVAGQGAGRTRSTAAKAERALDALVAIGPFWR